MNTASGIGMTSQRTRNRMVERLREKGISDEDVLNAMSIVPRHIFMDEALAHKAYEDTALPIKFGQTISQPWVVAKMTEILIENQPEKVLEIGTDSGYQAAVLSRLIKQVFSVERIDELTKVARKRFIQVGYRNIRTKTGDGFDGWQSEAPFDAIIVTAAPPQIPEKLVSQLKENGVMILPVGDDKKQNLIKVTKTANGYTEETISAVMFVPFLQGTVRK